MSQQSETIERREALQKFIDSVPQSVVLHGSNKARYKMVFYAIVCAALTLSILHRYTQGQGTLNSVLFMAAMTVLFVFFAAKHWKDARIPLVQFTHDAVTIKNISHPVPLHKIHDFSYIYDARDTLIFQVDNSLESLAVANKFSNLSGASVVVLKKELIEIRINVAASFQSNGKNLTPDEVRHIVQQYLDLVQAKKELVLS